MIRTRWKKVLLDLWSNRGRTMVVALAIAVGVYSVGVILDIQELLMREYGRDQAGALVATATVYTTPFSNDLSQRISLIPGIEAAEGRNTIRTTAKDKQGKRKDLMISAVPDFDNMQVNKVTSLAGSWPPATGEIILERLVLDYLDVEIGDTLTIELEDGNQKQLLISGTAHDPQQFNPDVTDTATGYLTQVSMEKLGFSELYLQMVIRVEPDIVEEAQVQAILTQVEDQIESSGRPVFSTNITLEGRQDAIMDTVILMLSAFGVVILLLSGFLVVNAISALITQQVPQIGVMKLIGAGRLQIMAMYLVTVLVYGLIAVAIGIPLAMISARGLMNMVIIPTLNVAPDSMSTSLTLITAQVAIGLLLPLIAGLWPVLKGTRITTHKALNDSGMETNVQGRGLSERFLAWIQSIRPMRRPVLLSIRNAMRHKGRMAQTMVVLIIGTALFISVLSVNTSVTATLQSFLNYHQYDVSVGMARPYRIDRLQRAVQEVPGVVDVESWSIAGATRQREDDSESDPFLIYAVPSSSALIDPHLYEGRWLSDEFPNGIVINSDVLDNEPDLRIGDDLKLDIAGKELVGTIIGIARTDSRGPSVYINHQDYAYATRTPGKATHVQVIAGGQDNADLEKQLFQALEADGFEVSSTRTAQQINDQNKLMFSIIVAILILMALLLAAVGGLGLTTTMSINMIERIREIGVLRAIGASNFSVRRIVLAEGLVIGALSWILGTLLSLPLSVFLSDQVGLALLKVPLSYQYSIIAAVVWFFALMLIAAAASLGPARSAVRLTIREVLAYE